MFRDVSDVERAQIEVRNNEKLLRTLIDHSVNGIVRFGWVDSPDWRKQHTGDIPLAGGPAIVLADADLDLALEAWNKRRGGAAPGSP